MASINIKKTPAANVSNPPSGSTSLYVNASGVLSLKDEAGNDTDYPTTKVLTAVKTEVDGRIDDLGTMVIRHEAEIATYNITNSIPLTTGYYTSTTARAAVPEGIRKTGLILTYETAAGVWYTERYIGTATDTTSWTTAGNWEIGVLRIAAVTDTTEYAEITI